MISLKFSHIFDFMILGFFFSLYFLNLLQSISFEYFRHTGLIFVGYSVIELSFLKFGIMWRLE